VRVNNQGASRQKRAGVEWPKATRWVGCEALDVGLERGTGGPLPRKFLMFSVSCGEFLANVRYMSSCVRLSVCNVRAIYSGD